MLACSCNKLFLTCDLTLSNVCTDAGRCSLILKTTNCVSDNSRSSLLRPSLSTSLLKAAVSILGLAKSSVPPRRVINVLVLTFKPNASATGSSESGDS